jgi:uncharacterized damage-inducible protein DinB
MGIISPDYFIQLFDYNNWANARYLEVAQALTSEQLFRQHGHSWGSAHSLLVHMMGAEWIWLSRWQGVSPKALLDPHDYPTLEAVLPAWGEIDAKLRAFAAAQTEASLVQPLTYTNTHGRTFTLLLWQLMAHLGNHGTHHRGELAAMFAMMEVPHPEEDWYLYFLAKSGQA